MTLEDIIGLIDHQAYITKSREDAIEVRLGWYSPKDHDKTYHICLECGHYGGILLSNLEIDHEDKLIEQGRELCDYCWGNLNYTKECQGVFLTVRGP